MNLKEKVRIVPDYPKQGIRFMDITTLFKDACLLYTSDAADEL